MKAAYPVKRSAAIVTGRCLSPVIDARDPRTCCGLALEKIPTVKGDYLPHLRCVQCGEVYAFDGTVLVRCENTNHVRLPKGAGK